MSKFPTAADHHAQRRDSISQEEIGRLTGAIRVALVILFLLLISAYAKAAPRPIRVLFLGHEDVRVHNSSALAALLMEKLGREAIYFDYATTPECLNRERLSHYDALMVYA